MTTPSPLSTPTPWNLVATHYAADIAPVFEHYAREALNLAALSPDSHIVDVACGPGTLSLLAAPSVRRVDALDFSPEMIATLTHRAHTDNVSNVFPVVGDGTHLPYSDATFNAAFSMFGLMFFPDRVQGLRELKRVTAPGNRVVIASWAPVEASNLRSVVMPALLGEDASPPVLPLSSEDELHTAMSQAGLTSVEIHRVSHSTTLPSVDAAWRGMQRSNAPIAHMRETTPPDQWEVLSQRVQSALYDVYGDGEVRSSMTALLSVGTV